MFKPLKRLLAGTLRRQLVVGMTLIVASMMSVFVWDMTRREQASEKERQTEQALALATSVAISSAEWVASRDLSGLQEIVQGLAQYPDLRHAIVLNLRGQVLAHTEPGRRGQYLDDLPRTGQLKVLTPGASLIDVAAPILFTGRQIGWVRIGLASDSLNAELARISRNGVIFVLIAVALSVLFSTLAGRYLTRRLRTIQQVADAVQSGHWELRADVNGDDEAAQLARQFNNMLESLGQRSAALHESFAALHSILETTLDGFWHLDDQGHLLDVNPAYSQQSGYRREELLGMNVSELEALGDHAATVARLERLTVPGRGLYETTHRRKNGSTWQVEVSMTFHPVAAGQFFAFLRDISERKQAEEKLRLAANVFTHAREGIMITSADGSLIDVNQAFTRITGYGRDQVLGKNPRILSSGRHDKQFYAAMWRDLLEKGHWYGEVWNQRKNGQLYAVMQTISAVRDAQGNTQHYVTLFSDITALKEHQKKLEHIAHFDALTNLPNRVLLADRLQQAMAQCQRRGHRVAVAYLDLDGFKSINDSHGHEAGDQLLVNLANHMKQALREGDTLARLGGDEFVAVLIDLPDVEASVPMLNRLLGAAAHPMQRGALALQVSASLGVTFYPQAQDIDADQLLRQADQAMYQAKLAGKNRYHVFDALQDSSLRVRYESLARIRLALAEHEFVLYYQPKVNMRTGQLMGAEALIRWRHPERGLLAPAMFLPVIEDHPLAVTLGEWVIDTALTQVERWRAAGLNLAVSVNVGARQLQQHDFVDQLSTLLRAHPQLDRGCLELEILETSALEDFAQVSQTIEDCAQLGVTFALDDFGTGYSSLTYLKRLRVGLLKIDKSFVHDMLDDPDDLAILQSVISLAAVFRRQVIAEGVETVAHGTLLLQLGCELAQGYGIARPMPADDLPRWAATWQPEPAWLATA